MHHVIRYYLSAFSVTGENDWLLKFQSILCCTPRHIWTKFGPNPSILTRVIVMTSVHVHNFTTFNSWKFWKKWLAPKISISSLPCPKASLDQIWSKSIDPNSSYTDDKRSPAQFYYILIRENSEKNDRPLKIQSVRCPAPGHLWTKFGPNSLILTRVIAKTNVSRAQFFTF